MGPEPRKWVIQTEKGGKEGGKKNEKRNYRLWDKRNVEEKRGKRQKKEPREKIKNEREKEMNTVQDMGRENKVDRGENKGRICVTGMKICGETRRDEWRG